MGSGLGRAVQRHAQPVPRPADATLRNRDPAREAHTPARPARHPQAQQHPGAQVDHHLGRTRQPWPEFRINWVGGDAPFFIQPSASGRLHPLPQTPVTARPLQPCRWSARHAPADPARHESQTQADRAKDRPWRQAPPLAQPHRHHGCRQRPKHRTAGTPRGLGAQFDGHSGRSAGEDHKQVKRLKSGRDRPPEPQPPGSQPGRRNTRVPLVPPKPKLFFTATSILISRATLAQ